MEGEEPGEVGLLVADAPEQLVLVAAAKYKIENWKTLFLDLREFIVLIPPFPTVTLD